MHCFIDRSYSIFSPPCKYKIDPCRLFQAKPNIRVCCVDCHHILFLCVFAALIVIDYLFI